MTAPQDTTRSPGDPRPALAEVSAEFRYFAERRAGGYAPLYARLGAAIADDPILLDLSTQARPGQSRPDLLLALIHQLLLRNPDHPAARFYRTITATPDPGDPVPDVLALAHDHHDDLHTEMRHRLVQTNEIGRCAFLAPAIRAAAAVSTPLALLEVGASAGLNLMLDQYGYRYHRSGHGGDADIVLAGEPVLHCELRSSVDPPVRQSQIVWRAGIDLHPLDVTDIDDRRWLRALVWPDHTDRAQRLDAALRVAAATPDRPIVHRGDAAAVLPHHAAAAPPGAHLVVFHSAVVAHMTPADRGAFTAAVLDCSRHRPLSWVQAEPRADRDPRRLRLLTCRDGRVLTERPLGSYHPHGQWLGWCPDKTA